VARFLSWRRRCFDLDLRCKGVYPNPECNVELGIQVALSRWDF